MLCQCNGLPSPMLCQLSYAVQLGSIPTGLGIFFMLARCGYTLRVTSQASQFFSPEYIAPRQKKSREYRLKTDYKCLNTYTKCRDIKLLFANVELRVEERTLIDS